MPDLGMKTVGDITVRWLPPVDPNNDVNRINVQVDAGSIHLNADLAPTAQIFTETVDVPDGVTVFSGTCNVRTYDAAGNSRPAISATFSYDLEAPPQVGEVTVGVVFRQVPIEPVPPSGE